MKYPRPDIQKAGRKYAHDVQRFVRTGLSLKMPKVRTDRKLCRG